MKFEVITRDQAAAMGRKRYYTGQPCKYRHDSQRFVTTGGCVACNAARSQMFSKKVTANGRVFTYALHPDDVAAALAYCQALDLQRGRTPADAGTKEAARMPRGNEPIAMHPDLAEKQALAAQLQARRIADAGVKSAANRKDMDPRSEEEILAEHNAAMAAQWGVK